MTERDRRGDTRRRRASPVAVKATLVVVMTVAWLLLPAVVLADNCVGNNEVKACAQLFWDSGFFLMGGALFAIGWGLGMLGGSGEPPKGGIPPDEDEEEGDGDEGERPKGGIPPDEHEEEQDGFEDGEHQEEE